ncbi:MAG: FtsX-like permease family protein [Lachnospiraceae bacterium]|nr:FtsX-like permease family protein [Lachnospiraceae bacterium]
MLIRKLFRTAWKYKAQFISMILMVAIGVGIFVGFNMEWYSLDVNTSEFFEGTNYADFRIYSETGFSEEEIERIQEIPEVEDASRVFAVNVDMKGDTDKLALFVPEKDTVSTSVLMEGTAYDADEEGFWLSGSYAKANNVACGDTLTLTYSGIEIAGKVKGLIYSAEYMVCVADENQLMPDYDNFGFVYASPQTVFGKLRMEFYPQINICSELEKNEMEDALRTALGKTTLVTSKEEHYPYAGAQSEIEEGKTMAAILPVLFLGIAILTMVTTMHRISSNEKVQIGTLKALGFKDRRILRHYTSYGLFLGVVGSVIGIALGYLVAWVVVNPNGMMGTFMDMPNWTLYVPWIGWIMVVLTIVLLTLISLLSVKKMLWGTAADALRPYQPKKVKAMKIEGTKLWEKMAFATKWNFRDVMRHKSRSFMTLFGILGCMLLLVGGLGMKDTMKGFISLIDEEVYDYNTKINIVETADNETVEQFAEKVGGDWMATSGIQLEDKTVSLEIYDVTHDMVRFIDEDNAGVTLEDDGAYICIRLAENGIKVGDTVSFSPYGEEETYSVKVAGILRSVLTENLVMTKEYAEQVGIPYHISSVFTMEAQENIKDEAFISGKQSKQALMESFDAFMEIMNIMVYILVLAAVVLGIIVLYNLGIMSYVERSRELATLKVLGFKDKQIGKILISQNVWLTVVGVIIGLPSGVGVLYVLIKALASEYELRLIMGPLTYVVSIVVTFGVSIVVGLFVARKNKKIDMVEALKGTE